MPRRRRPATALAVAVLALVAVSLSACEMPESGRYSSQQHTVDQLTTTTDIVYGTATDYRGVSVELKLDLYLPPDEGVGPRPVVILVHGGSFTSGNKSQMAGTARAYAQRGFAAVSIGYRLNPNASMSNMPVYLATVLNAIDDGMESVRWVRANATVHDLDAGRIAMVGSSAGGGLALGVGALDDPTPGGPLAAHSPKIRAAVSTGASLTPGVDLGVISYAPDDAPALMYHYETDTVTGWTDEYAREACDAMNEAGALCRFVLNSGSGHTVSLSPTSAQWTGFLGTFLWNHLDLRNAAGA